MLDFGSPLDGIRSPLGPRRGRAFSPSTLFALAEPGVWFDPSDLTTLFQDPAGTTPVTGPTGPTGLPVTVGLMLDKSKGLALGAELVSNGDFSGGTTTGWTAQVNATISVEDGQLKAVVSTPSSTGVWQDLATVAGKTYRLTASIRGTAGTLGATVYNGAFASIIAENLTYPENGVLTAGSLVFTAISTQTRIIFSPGATATTYYIDNISVRELAGNHATQGITAARPTYSIEPVGGRRNRILYSEQFNNAVFTPAGVTVSPDTAIAPDGTLTADQLIEAAGVSTHIVYSGVTGFTTTTISIMAKANSRSVATIACNDGGPANWAAAAFNLSAPGAAATAQSGGTFSAISSITPLANDWYRCVLSVTSSGLAVAQVKYGPSNVTNPTFGSWGDYSYTGVSGNGVFVWGAQLETGSTATAYQRVTTQHDVTEAGVASVGYLYFDGSDDHMVTSTISPATDKAQVFIGVKKLSDAQPRGLLDYGPSWTTYTGSFAIYAPSYLTGGLPAPKYYVAMKGAAGQRETDYATYTAPITNVLSTLFDISEPAASEILMRIDGAVIAPAASGGSAVTGNFNNLALQIGRIGTGASANVNLYSLITRFGPTLDAPTIASTEVWVAGKTGFYTPIITGVPTIGVS